MLSPFTRMMDGLAEYLACRIAEILMQPKAGAQGEAPAPTPDPQNVCMAPVTPQQAWEQTQADTTRTASPPELPEPPVGSPVKIEQLMLDLVRKIGREKTIAALAEYGVKKASELAGDELIGFRAWAVDTIGAKS